VKLPIQHGILVNGEHWDFDKKILDACQINERIIVIFDYMSYPKNPPARNMMAFDLDKNEIWTAENPTNKSVDAYYKIGSENPLVAYNVASYECTIDVSTGRLIKADFYK